MSEHLHRRHIPVRGLLGAGALALLLGAPLAQAGEAGKTSKATVSPPDEQITTTEDPVEIGDPGASGPYTGLQSRQIEMVEDMLTEQQRELDALRRSLKDAHRGIGDPGEGDAGDMDRSALRDAMDHARKRVENMQEALDRRMQMLEQERQRLDVESRGIQTDDAGDTG